MLVVFFLRKHGGDIIQKKMVDQMIQETQQCLIQFWKKNSTYVAKSLSESIMWIGALEAEFMQGREEVEKDLIETSRTNPSCHLLHQEFWCAAKSDDMCVVVGRYFVTTDDGSREIIQEPQRATFVWRMRAKDIFLEHMHVSSPIGYLEENELFPHKIGRTTYQYLKELEDKCRGQEKSIEVREINGHIRFLSEAEIEYAEAKDHNTIISVVNGSPITAKMEWAKFQNIPFCNFVKVHRSFIVNRKYIRSIGRREIEMVSGARIPMPAKKQQEIYERIKKGR